ncbi:MAG: tRNA (adenosine(37)-N6)-dimethylallyltransferase MiaA [Chloroflexota bacterium]
MPPLIVIAGATATGKTALALALAERIRGAEIISADSRQVYRGMDIGTAKPTRRDQATTRHHCLDLVDPDGAFTAATYRRHALDALRGISERGGVGLLTGGTGLYLRIIARGLPLGEGDADPAVRAQLEKRLAETGLDPLVTELLGRDAEGATSLDLRNPRRVIRALERAIVSGTAAPPKAQGYPAPQTWLGLRLAPDAHRSAIGSRIEQQFQAGLLDEAQRLRERYPEDLPAFSAMGYHEAFDVLAGRSGIDDAKAADARRTWSYARRQRTWFASEPGIEWLETGEGVLDRAHAHVAPWLRRIGHPDYPAQ